MKEYFGWTQASRMAAIYVHLSGRDVDDAILKLHGMRSAEEEKDSGLQPKRCVWCSTTNPATNRYCSLCGRPLSADTVEKVVGLERERARADEILDQMLQDARFKDAFVSRLKEVISEMGKQGN